MAQDASKWFEVCAKCEAGVGRPCIERHGRTAEKVHYGRGQYRRAEYRRKPARRAAAPVRLPFKRTGQYVEAHREVERRRFGD